MITCPLNNRLCEGKICAQIMSVGMFGDHRLIMCEKMEKAEIYLINKEGMLVKV